MNDDSRLSDEAYEARVREQWEEAKVGLIAVGLVTLLVAATGVMIW